MNPDLLSHVPAHRAGMILSWILLTGALLVLFGVLGNMDQPDAYGKSALGWMVSRWNWSGADMSHAWLVPVISLWILWQGRSGLLATPLKVDRRGLWVVGLAMVCYLAGVRVQQTRLVLMSLILLLWGIPFYCWGWALARKLIFPCAYLIFCIPFTFLDDLTLPLRLISTSVSAGLLNGLGISVTRVGTAMQINAGGGFSLDVAHPCSGLRYLVAMIALTTAYAYFTQKVVWKRIVLSLASIPIAMIGNIARIFLIALVGVFWSKEVAVGFYHDYSGYVVFGVATILMIWVGGFLKRVANEGAQELVQFAPNPSGAGRHGVSPAHVMVVFSLLLLLVLGYQWVARVQISDENTADVSLILPEKIGDWHGQEVMYCQNDQCGHSFLKNELRQMTICMDCNGELDAMALGERTLLPKDTRIIRKIYETPAGGRIVATIVLTGGDQRSIHRPQQCLPAQGLSVGESKVVNFKTANDLIRKMTMLHADPPRSRSGADQTRQIFAYWFQGGGHETHDHLERVFWTAWDNLVWGRRARWAYVSLQAVEHGDCPLSDQRVVNFAGQFHSLIQGKKQ